jgi:DNA-directed RNA polymerase subunit RPC12/RpoP
VPDQDLDRAQGPEPPKLASAPDASGAAADANADSPQGAIQPSRRVHFPCKNCGAEMRWDPDIDALLCEYCGSKVQVPRSEGTIVEHTMADAGGAARGFGVELKVVRCANCGAQVTFDERTTSRECVFCGSAQVLEQSANRNALRPESLLPLDVGRDTVEKEFRKWLGTLWLRPTALRQTRGFDAIGVYLPFWTYDCRVHSDWSADAGYYYWETETYMSIENGRPVMRTRQVQRVRWVPAWGARDDTYDDVLVLASRGLPEKLASELGAFDTKKLVPYRPEYLAGWRAEEYAVDLENGWNSALARVEKSQESRCAADIPGDTHRSLRVANKVGDVRWKHVLLPLWTLSYNFGGKRYAVLINGQTGRVVGDAPYSWVKILFLVLAILLGVVSLVAMLTL